MAKKIVKVLFRIKEKKVNVYEYRNGDFESIQEAGEEDIEYTDDFMDWFRKAIAYSKTTDKLDYIILTDNSVKLNFDDKIYDIVNDSFWNKQRIREFNSSVLLNQGLILKTINNREYYRFNVGRNPLEYTVLFCDKNVNRGLPKEVTTQQKINKPIKKDKIEDNIDLSEKEKNAQAEMEVTATVDIQEEAEKPNIALYYKEVLKNEEEERMKIKSKF